ncbi:response regulator [Pseudomonas typographi]
MVYGLYEDLAFVALDFGGTFPTTAKDDADRLAGAHVLVIDDDEAVRTGMADLIQDWGARCTIAEGLAEALSLQGAAPDAIICDYRLREGADGADVINRLRQHHRLHIPALLVTGDTAPERLRDAMSSGIPLMHKPVAPAHLRHWLVNIMP